MKVLLLGVSAAAFIYAVMKEGSKSVITDTIILITMCTGFTLMYFAYKAQLAGVIPGVIMAAREVVTGKVNVDSTNPTTKSSAMLNGYKYLNVYKKIRDVLDALDLVSEYNEGDYYGLAANVDKFVKKYQKVFMSGWSREVVAMEVDVMIDLRDQILKTVQGFFVSVLDSSDKIRAQLLKLQSISYHMIKKIQNQSGVKRLTFPKAYEEAGFDSGCYIIV